jgi:hypothetical protein
MIGVHAMTIKERTIMEIEKRYLATAGLVAGFDPGLPIPVQALQDIYTLLALLRERDVYIHQLRGALGYPVPGDIAENPDIKNGIAEALQIQLREREGEIATLRLEYIKLIFPLYDKEEEIAILKAELHAVENTLCLESIEHKATIKAFDEQEQESADLRQEKLRHCACEFEDGVCVSPCKYHGDPRQEVERLRKEMEAQKIWHELF